MKPDQRTPGAMTIERKGRLAGTLLVTPASIKAGETLSVAVENAGKVTMFYGLENRVERRTDCKWEDATGDVYGTRSPAVRAILLKARPGERAGPRYDAVADGIPLPRTLTPGTYRVVKHVSGDARSRPPRLRLTATFDVRG